MKTLKHTLGLLFLSSILVLTACKKEELPAETFISFRVDDRLYLGADIETELGSGVMTITSISATGQLFTLKMDKNIRKGKYDIDGESYPFLVYNDQKAYRCVSGELKIKKHNVDESYVMGSFSGLLVGEKSEGESLQMTDGEFYIVYENQR